MTKETYQVGQEASFLSAFGERIKVTVEEINLHKAENNQISELFFTISVPSQTYEKIITESLFNLFPEIGITQPQNEFDSDAVEIELKLKPSLIAYLNQQMEKAKDLGGLMSSDESEDWENNCLYYTENWLATTFKQAMSLPPELEAEGELKQGYQTLWNNLDLMREKLTTSTQSNPEVILDFLNHKGWKYEQFNENITKLSFNLETLQLSVLIALTPDEQEICCYSVYPEAISADQRGQFAIFIAGLNYELTVGNFEMDFEDGELRLRTSLPLTQISLTETMLDSIVTANLEMTQRYFPQFQQLQSELN
ncbi:YbjN domain-containing protein [Spirulina sp. CS-785/01]|uniref:YbjN domain-containing protein n=1 Tax=Spirulina sp. CS-785/01 TaxID=3021716 RepID=UPI00232C5848|nr:YbjN domain-containing protein [Spirulina sp. CS-785/01]MDB9311967.1 YbjN domain-containing protein [Spirulina sp. CS-785/01]